MANSLGLSSVNVIAQEALAYLASEYPVIGQIATDLSTDGVAPGSSILATIPTVGTLQDYNETDGYVAAPATGSAVTVTLNKHKHATFALTETELCQGAKLEAYAQSFAEAIGQGVMTDIAALFTTGNISNSSIVPFTGANVANLINKPNAELTKRNVPKNRFGIFNPDYYNALFNDDQVIAFNRDGLGVTSTALPVIHGVTVSEMGALPTTSNLVGVIAHRSAIVFASRVPCNTAHMSAPTVADISVVTDPKSGLSVRVSKWYDPQKGKLNVSFALIYGVAVADGSRAQLIRSA